MARWRGAMAVAAGLTMACTMGCGSSGGGDDPGDAHVDTDAGPPPFEPDLYCPGSGTCPEGPGTGPLEVGVGMADITGIDADGNLVPTDQPAEWEGDGDLNAAWLAGWGNPGAARAAQGVHDPQWARAVALRHENTTVVIASIDTVGYFVDEVDRIRDAVADLGVHYLLVSATHVHSARDTVGLWGPDLVTTALEPQYQQFVRDQVEQAVRDAVDSLAPAHVQYNAFRLRDLSPPPEDSPAGVVRFVGDGRDPNIVDDEVRLMRFMRADGGDTIATVVNWSSHPEYSGSSNYLLSSDFAHWLREGIEGGVEGPDGWVDGLGGMAMYVNGTVGGQIGPNNVDIRWWDGTEVPEKDGLDDGDMSAPGVVGQQLAYYVLQSLGEGGGSVTDETAAVGFRSKRFYVSLQNTAFQMLFGFGIFDRELYNYDPELAFSPDNTPEVLTEVGVIDIGRAQLVTTPGELYSEAFIGGYDGEHTPDGQPFLWRDDLPPPDIDNAPEAPYLRDLARDDASHVWLVGLGNDFLGYLIPSYDYILAEDTPYATNPPGHYEETVSVGPDGWPTIQWHTEQLLTWRPQ
jgi:hypothetical protein